MNVDEPLELSAPLAWREAERRCPDASAATSCRPYHRVWQYLRLLGVITTLRTNSGFFLDVFGAAAREGRAHVIISGAADYAMLAHLLHAYRTADAVPQPTVLDLCDTPLFLNRWYADRHGCDVRTAHADALLFQPDEPADLVCSHNFLGRFSEEERPHLLACWASWLRPGGLLVTTQRVRPGWTGAVVSYTADEARRVGERVAAAAKERRAAPGIHAEELGQAAREYALRKRSHAIADPASLTRAFDAAGFEILVADKGGGQAERQRDRPASSAGADTYRMRLVARRR